MRSVAGAEKSGAKIIKKHTVFLEKALSILMVFSVCLVGTSLVLVLFFNTGIYGSGVVSLQFTKQPPALTKPNLPQNVDKEWLGNGFEGDSIFNVDNLQEGYLLVRYTSAKRVCVILEKEGKKVREDLPANGDFSVISLNFGNGAYTATLYKQNNGDLYDKISSVNFTAVIEDPFKRFLLSIPLSTFQENTTVVQVAQELYAGSTSEEDFVAEAFRWVGSTIAYEEESLDFSQSNGYLPDLEQIAAERNGMCADYASVFAAMLRSCGIPCQIVYGNVETTTGKRYHAWNMVWLEDLDGEGKWWRYDPTSGKGHLDPERPYSAMDRLFGHSRYEEAKAVR